MKPRYVAYAASLIVGGVGGAIVGNAVSGAALFPIMLALLVAIATGLLILLKLRTQP